MGKRTKRLLKVVLIAVPLTVIVVGIVLFMSLNRLIKAGIETVGPRVLQTAVTVESVKISPLSGKGRISRLVVGNPDGFKTTSAFELDNIAVAVDLGSLKSGNVVIDELIIDVPQITYEQGLSKSNIQQLLRNAREYAERDKDKDEDKDRDDSEDDSEKKLIIRHLQVNGATARVGVTVLGSRTVKAVLPDIELNGIGEKSGGVTAAEALGEIMVAVLEGIKNLDDAALEAAVDISEESLEAAGAVVEEAEEAAAGALEAGSDAIGEGADAIKGTTSKVTGSLKGLLGGKEKKDEDK